MTLVMLLITLYFLESLASLYMKQAEDMKEQKNEDLGRKKCLQKCQRHFVSKGRNQCKPDIVWNALGLRFGQFSLGQNQPMQTRVCLEHSGYSGFRWDKRNQFKPDFIWNTLDLWFGLGFFETEQTSANQALSGTLLIWGLVRVSLGQKKPMQTRLCLEHPETLVLSETGQTNMNQTLYGLLLVCGLVWFSLGQSKPIRNRLCLEHSVAMSLEDIVAWLPAAATMVDVSRLHRVHIDYNRHAQQCDAKELNFSMNILVGACKSADGCSFPNYWYKVSFSLYTGLLKMTSENSCQSCRSCTFHHTLLQLNQSKNSNRDPLFLHYHLQLLNKLQLISSSKQLQNGMSIDLVHKYIGPTIGNVQWAFT
uniref:Uncharacterized protein n=1 Tax=Timema douglasi TaxID=61478 RepID=A0A7R8VPZ3_TIMDO|nr:unnamed protein product [Timema douglasi]